MNERPSPLIVLLQSVVLFMSQLLDYYTTKIGIKLGAVESNGLIKTVIEGYGMNGLLVTKLLLAAVTALGCRRFPAAAWFLCALMCGVALWNLHIISQLLSI